MLKLSYLSNLRSLLKFPLMCTSSFCFNFHWWLLFHILEERNCLQIYRFSLFMLSTRQNPPKIAIFKVILIFKDVFNVKPVLIDKLCILDREEGAPYGKQHGEMGWVCFQRAESQFCLKRPTKKSFLMRMFWMWCWHWAGCESAVNTVLTKKILNYYGDWPASPFICLLVPLQDYLCVVIWLSGSGICSHTLSQHSDNLGSRWPNNIFLPSQ